MLTQPRSRWSRCLPVRPLAFRAAGRRICGWVSVAACALAAQSGLAQSGPPATTVSQQESLAELQQVQHRQLLLEDERIHAMPRQQQKIDLITRRSQLIVTRDRVRRIHISDPTILEVVQFSETEFSLIGMSLGVTDLTFWFEGSPDPLMYQVTTIPDPALEEQRRLDYGKIEQKLALLYPNSKVYLIPMSQKIIVRGQARDAEEAARIMQIVRGEVLTQEGGIFAGYGNRGRGGLPVEPTGAGVAGAGLGAGGAYGTGFSDLLSSYIVNELQVPGEFQVKIRVRIAELNRSQLRRLGVDWSVAFNNARHVITSNLGGAAGVLGGVFESGDVTVLLDALASNGTAKVLEDAVVITMSGNPASFLSGGEFAVPNTVGNNGVLVGTTTFRGFGTSIITTPTIVDDDLIRLQIVPELSAVNSSNAVGGVPGVDVRRVQTIVELREGQTIVLGGLFSRRQQAEVTRIPLLGEIPILGTHLFNSKQATEDETELLIVVTPEIVRPMDPEEVPPLPGFYVTHPDDFDFYKYNRTDGNPDLSHYRLLPYGNGNGYGENAGFGYPNPEYRGQYGGGGMVGPGHAIGPGGPIDGAPFVPGHGTPPEAAFLPHPPAPGSEYQMMHYEQPSVTAPSAAVETVAEPGQTEDSKIEPAGGIPQSTRKRSALISPKRWFRLRVDDEVSE